MGYNSTATTLTLTAKLTPLGRQKMVSTNNALIKTFSLGDSDANYYTNLTLGSGQVPGVGGDIGPNNTIGNSTTQSVGMKTMLIVNSSGALRKPVSSQSINILSEILPNGFTTVTGASISQNVVNRDDSTTDPLVNLYYSFGLPLNYNDDTRYTGVTYTNGGFSDTALSAFSTSKILVLAINNTNYGECIDGKTVKIELPTSAGTYTIYSTFQGAANNLVTMDTMLSDSALQTNQYGNNIAVLVSDDIMTPNGGNPSLSWATGYNTEKPFSLNRKQTYNFQTNSNMGVTADTLVGIVYLDKGFAVITNPTIVNNYTSSMASATTISFNSVSTNVYQSVTCIADRGEFGSTTNPTFDVGDIPRISEVGLFDENNNLIAVAKTDRHINKNVNEFLALGIKITL
ncbi:MAG: hypothetical protein E6R13_07110 [Spirochaetes bacterium]|nr:MAG: hypothetical protein E6R13_07110 [Spirochaetota bacterium]